MYLIRRHRNCSPHKSQSSFLSISSLISDQLIEITWLEIDWYGLIGRDWLGVDQWSIYFFSKVCVHKIAFVQHFTRTNLNLEWRVWTVWNMWKTFLEITFMCAPSFLMCDHLATSARVHVHNLGEHWCRCDRLWVPPTDASLGVVAQRVLVMATADRSIGSINTSMLASTIASHARH